LCVAHLSFPRCPCRPNSSHFRPSKSPSLSRQAVTSHTDSTLGGGALACTATAQANLGAGAPLGATAAVVEDRPNCATTVGLLWTVSAAVGEQNGDPLSPRSCRWKPYCIWCPVCRVRSPPRQRPWRLPGALFYRCRRMKEMMLSLRILSQWPRLEAKIPLHLIKI
jgi:hypothetical protein